MLYCKVFLIPYSPFIAYMTTQLKKSDTRHLLSSGRFRCCHFHYNL